MLSLPEAAGGGSVREPSTLVLLLAGACLIGYARRRRAWGARR